MYNALYFWSGFDGFFFVDLAGRSIVNFSDVAMAFEKMGVNVTELHDYIREVESFGLSKVETFSKINIINAAKS